MQSHFRNPCILVALAAPPGGGSAELALLPAEIGRAHRSLSAAFLLNYNIDKHRHR
jgi:hypothetical protein